jgi:uncharacterized surface protein with fasciclin (FAS1) repeats
MTLRPVVIVAGVTLAVALVAGCGSSKSSAGSSPTSASTPGTPASSSGTPASSSAAPASSPAAAASTLFGSGCATLGLTAASTALAGTAPVGTVAAQAPFLKNVVAAATAAGIIDTLNAAPALTVFAPTDSAFAKEPAGLLQSLLTDPTKKPQLIATLDYAVVGSELTKDQLVGTHPTLLSGKSITVAGSGDSYTVNGNVKILCGGLKTKNAIVYVIDTVLHPAS